MRTGEELYRLVEEYSDLGEHRTGTFVDQPTIGWLAGILRHSGATVEFQSFTFDRYDAEWEVRLDGEPIQSLPLFYEGLGQDSTDNPATMTWAPGLAHTGLDPAFNEFALQALDRGASAAVVATGGPTGLLHAVNREPVIGSGLPTLLVPGAYGEQLGTADLSVEIDARIAPGESSNVVARFGEGAIEDTLIITTPISGWFRCAGERGTGIAVAIAAAETLALDIPVLFIGASGHELHHQGARRALEAIQGRPRAIVHIGASVAAAAEPPVNGRADLTPDLLARIAADSGIASRIESILAATGIRSAIPAQPANPDAWAGEAKNWARFERPMLSLVGGFPLFHAPEDTPDRATTPTLLKTVTSSVTTAIQSLIA